VDVFAAVHGATTTFENLEYPFRVAFGAADFTDQFLERGRLEWYLHFEIPCVGLSTNSVVIGS
jgi:hypothetical protein